MKPLLELRDLSTIKADLEDQRRLVEVGKVIADHPALQALLQQMHDSNIDQLSRLDAVAESDRTVAMAVATVSGKLQIIRFLHGLGLNLTTHTKSYQDKLIAFSGQE